MKNRLDKEVFARRLARSRSSARTLILRGAIKVNGAAISEPDALVGPDDRIEATERERFVSRAGEKLAGALDTFGIDPNGLETIDIGSSTGGFTDCLLKRGARRVIAVDVGTGQFDQTLGKDPRVELHETTDVRTFSLPSPVDIAVVDVSFISATLVLGKAFEFLRPGGRAIVLVKPQFEAGPAAAKSGKGVISSDALRREAVEGVRRSATAIGFSVRGEIVSPIEGEKGNREFLLLLEK